MMFRLWNLKPDVSLDSGRGRQESAHLDVQRAVRRELVAARHTIDTSERRIGEIEQNVATRTPTKRDLFAMPMNGRSYSKPSQAGGRGRQPCRVLRVRKM